MASGDNDLPVTCRLYLRVYDADDELVRVYGPEVVLRPGDGHTFEWRVADTGGAPIAEVGLEVGSTRRTEGTVYLDYLTWEGPPDVVLTRPRAASASAGGTMWRRVWVNGVDEYRPWYPEAYRLIQNRGVGLLIQGTREWTDYRVSADVTPHMVTAAGIAARVQGMRRFYALLLCVDAAPSEWRYLSMEGTPSEGRRSKSNGVLRFVKALDGNAVLAERDFAWTFGETHDLSLEVVDARLRAWVDGRQVFDVCDDHRPLASGAVALVCQEGRTATDVVRVQPPA